MVDMSIVFFLLFAEVYHSCFWHKYAHRHWNLSAGDKKHGCLQKMYTEVEMLMRDVCFYLRHRTTLRERDIHGFYNLSNSHELNLDTFFQEFGKNHVIVQNIFLLLTLPK